MHLRLSFLLALLCSSACAQPSATADSADVFRDDAIGLAVTKPAGWVFVTREQSMQNRSRTELEDEALEREVRRDANAPTVSIAKYPEPHPTVNPTVQIKHVPGAGLSPEETLRTFLDAARGGYRDFHLVQPVRLAELSGHPAAHAEATFTMVVSEGQRFAVHTSMWAVTRGDDVFVVGLSAPPTGPDVSREAFAEILSSLEIQ